MELGHSHMSNHLPYLRFPTYRHLYFRCSSSLPVRLPGRLQMALSIPRSTPISGRTLLATRCDRHNHLDRGVRTDPHSPHTRRRGLPTMAHRQGDRTPRDRRILSIPLWLLWESRCQHRMVPFRLLRDRAVWAALGIAVMLNFGPRRLPLHRAHRRIRPLHPRRDPHPLPLHLLLCPHRLRPRRNRLPHPPPESIHHGRHGPLPHRIRPPNPLPRLPILHQAEQAS